MLTDRGVYETLRNAILAGTLEPGQALVESQLAEWYGVSRTPIREALTRLEQDGLVERRDRGLVIRERSPEQILDIYEIRILLEATAARFAAERCTSVDKIRLRRAAQVFEEVDPSDEAEFALRNRDFHATVWRASHNDSLADLLMRLNLHLARYPATTLAVAGRREEAIAEHAALVDAIIAGDSQAAEECARRHFTRARDIRLELWERDLY